MSVLPCSPLPPLLSLSILFLSLPQPSSPSTHLLLLHTLPSRMVFISLSHYLLLSHSPLPFSLSAIPHAQQPLTGGESPVVRDSPDALAPHVTQFHKELHKGLQVLPKCFESRVKVLHSRGVTKPRYSNLYTRVIHKCPILKLQPAKRVCS